MIEPPKRVYLEPDCEHKEYSESPLWCQDPVWPDCKECGAPSPGYVRDEVLMDARQVINRLGDVLSLFKLREPLTPTAKQLIADSQDALDKLESWYD